MVCTVSCFDFGNWWLLLGYITSVGITMGPWSEKTIKKRSPNQNAMTYLAYWQWARLLQRESNSLTRLEVFRELTSDERWEPYLSLRLQGRKLSSQVSWCGVLCMPPANWQDWVSEGQLHEEKNAGCLKTSTQPLRLIVPSYFHSARSKFKEPVVSSKARFSPNLAAAWGVIFTLSCWNTSNRWSTGRCGFRHF